MNEDQQTELEALRSIYDGDFECISFVNRSEFSI
jgi:hypothetical protein